jgi:hypothetical protein
MSSYNSPLPVGSPEGTGAAAIAIAETPGGTNTNGNATDSAGNVKVDFVWGNYPMQPNDVRTEEAAGNFGGTTGSDELAYRTAVVTAASGNGTTVTYTAANSFHVGQTVTITGLATSALNLSNVLIASLVGTEGARTGFTVTNAASGSDSAQTAVAKVVVGEIPGVGADASWSATTKVAGARLDAALDNHANAEAEWNNYPAFTPGAGNYKVTAASGNGTTVTYTAQNNLAVGDVVNITGLTASAYNLSGVTVATADALKFTVTNAANAGEITGQWYGKVESTTALTAADGAGIGYIVVPSVLGETTAVALDELKDAGYETANITTASAATNTATQPTRINVTSTTEATVTISGGTSTWAVGTKVTIASGTGIPAALVGTWRVTGGSGSTLVIAGSGWTVADTGAITPGTALTGTAGTIKTQSTAAGASSVATTATITITPWAAAA